MAVVWCKINNEENILRVKGITMEGLIGSDAECVGIYPLTAYYIEQTKMAASRNMATREELIVD